MSEPETAPVGDVAVPRDSARVIVLDERDRVLLFEILDPLDTRATVWATPGGGVEPGETLAEAAARELAEETGLRVPPHDLSGPVAVTSGEWNFRGVRYRSVDSFFVHHTTCFAPDDTDWSDLERQVHRSFRWCATDELSTLDGVVLPSGLGDLVRRLAGGEPFPQPVELPWLAV